MSIENIILTALLLLIAATSISVSIYWHIATRGAWRVWAAGRSLMALLVIITLGYGWGGVNRMLGDYALKQPILAVLYGCLALGVAVIGLTIRKELAAGKSQPAAKTPEDPTGLIAMIMPTTTEENPDGKP